MNYFLNFVSVLDKSNGNQCTRTCEAALLANGGWVQHSQYWSSFWYGTSTWDASKTCGVASRGKCLITWIDAAMINLTRLERSNLTTGVTNWGSFQVLIWLKAKYEDQFSENHKYFLRATCDWLSKIVEKTW